MLTITDSYKPGSKWVNSHWMSLNGKRDEFSRKDLYSLEKLSPLFTRSKINTIIDEIIEYVSQWQVLATEYEVPESLIDEVGSNLRLDL
ncbi:hypothetical protein XBO1_1970026 [Xenorhabdus bovienii str. oregonense]|uniref:Uncharacterized protein n=1 Tax=Xenorhabdus bovienii str. oregonense TaxID=1398202 RepID=A0A077P3P7_XENBV|nr:hypothetical protein XBO1_1970026 [Xenorhabdus bovienii str. oregonense]